MTNNFKKNTKSRNHSNVVFGYRSHKLLVISNQSGAPRQGQAALSLVFLIGGIALLVSVTLAVIAISFLNSTFAFQSANRAYANATSGAQDALLKLARNDTFNDTVGYVVPKDCTSNCATVVVTQITPGTQVEIVSTATVFASTRKIKVIASIDPNNGEVSVSSWTNLDL
jgi:hypothetical protein